MQIHYKSVFLYCGFDSYNSKITIFLLLNIFDFKFGVRIHVNAWKLDSEKCFINMLLLVENPNHKVKSGFLSTSSLNSDNHSDQIKLPIWIWIKIKGNPYSDTSYLLPWVLCSMAGFFLRKSLGYGVSLKCFGNTLCIQL